MERSMDLFFPYQKVSGVVTIFVSQIGHHPPDFFPGKKVKSY